MEGGRVYWFGEHVNKGEEGMEQASGDHPAPVAVEGKGMKSTSQVVTSTTSDGKP